MKKAICMAALAAISYGTVYAAMPSPMQQDTAKVKIKKKGDKVKIKKKLKDTTKVK